ncbi:hypothetical protein ACFW91_15635 [Streptomyces asoensis]|uniref:hypothetical protein n=1 Tax=Streptomyces asoensis TaxID=249586 RepID=UPI00369AE4C2
MPRGRHRHSPPLHRLLPPSAIAGVSLVCALGPWVFTEPAALRGLAAAAAATAILGAVVMRRWDMQAGKQVADLARSRASDEWRYEERVAELESDLDESRELRVKLEQRLRSKRAELAGLRNEHAALLRRYATAETERASALEGRRLLEIEAAPTPALPAARSAQDAETAGTGGPRDTDVDADVQGLGNAAGADGADVVEGTDASEAGSGAREAAGTDEIEETEETEETDEVDGDDTEDGGEAEGETKAEAVFSPEGSKLFLRAQAALDRLDSDRVGPPKADDDTGEEPAQAAAAEVGAQAADGGAEAAQEDEAQGNPEAVDEHARATAPHQARETEDTGTATDAVDGERDDAGANRDSGHAADADAAAGAADAVRDADEADRAEAGAGAGAVTAGGPVDDTEPVRPAVAPHPVSVSPSVPAAAEAEAEAAAAAAAGAGAGAIVPRPAGAVQRRPSGHFAVPTAVAVVPAAQPLRRPTAEGGFDFFGTKNASPHALEAVQNEDLADVVGQEALALHKAESEAAEFKPVDEAARGVGQVIDLTAHDETEQIDLQGLRSAVS